MAETFSGRDGEDWIRRIRSVRQRRAARTWWARRGEGADPATMARLAADWQTLVRRGARSSPPQHLYSLFSLLSARRPTELPKVETTAHVLRTLRASAAPPVWQDVERLFGAGGACGPEAGEAWSAVHEKLREERRARETASVAFEEVQANLVVLLRHFFSGAEGLVLKADRSIEGRFTAFTDGRRIHLPPRIAVSPHAELNRWGFVRLLAHEAGHLADGTYRFSFRSPAGQRVWARLESRRETFQEARLRWNRDRIVERLEARGESVPATLRPQLTHLSAFFLHFRSPKAVHGLFNLVEDVRIERLLADRYPGLGLVAEVLSGYEAAQAPHPRLASAHANFVRALYDVAMGRVTGAFVGSAFQAAFVRAAALLERYRREPVGAVETAVETTLSLAEILSEHLPREETVRVAALLGQSRSVDPDEVSVILELVREEEVDSDAWRPRRGRNEASPPEGPRPNGERYPEYDAGQERLRRDAVVVREVRLRAARGGARRGSAPVVAPIRPSGSSRRRPFPSSDGVDLDLARAYDWHVSRRLGREGDDRIFRAPRRSDPGLAVSFVFDLSVSMEAPRAGLAPAEPLALGILAVRSLASALQGTDVTVGFFGAHDGGGRPVTFHVLKDHDEPQDTGVLDGLSTVGVGGFRIGTVLRHLDARSRRLPAGTRHVAVLVTDDASHYYGGGLDKMVGFVNRTHCSTCRSRGKCTVEPRTPSTSMPSGSRSQVNLSFAYERADVCHARTRLRNVRPVFLLLGSAYPDTHLNALFGRRQWARMLSARDLAGAREVLGKAIDERRADVAS